MQYDILVIGSGIAGLSTALAAAPKRVAVITRGSLGDDGASCWAQGGIAAALASDDSPALHARDTLIAGQYLNDSDAVQRLTSAAAEAVQWLDRLGARFDRDRNGAYALGREAAHSRSRIVHANGDASGAEVMRCLRVAARAATHLDVLEQHTALQLIVHRGRVAGVRAHSPQGETEILATNVILATGGIGALYRYTTNPTEADASGLALALDAGAELADLEFVQFHPTALAPLGDGGGQLPLLTEALRGAGAALINDSGKRFMQAWSPHAELAPRDIVARAVWQELQRGQRVWLDATRAVGAEFSHRFPTVYASCMARGIDPCTTPLPVVPAQHYHMGGVRVDAAARSSVPGLYAVGEVACSGVHGANRLASNSLLEGLVFGRSLGMRLAQECTGASEGVAQARTAIDLVQPASPELAARLADLMWQHAGLVREESGLRCALHELARWREASQSGAGCARLIVCERIVLAALQRRDSVGAHFRRDGAESRRTG